MSVEIFQHKLSNGLRIIGEFSPSAYSCAIGSLVCTGSRDETPEESGLSHFLEHMLFKGTDTRDTAAINNRFGELGAQANAYTSVENTVYYASVQSKFQNEYLELLCDMLRPKLDPNDFNMEKKVILEEIALKFDDVQTNFYFEAVSDYFKDHPIGNLVLGTTESVTALTVEQMNDYFWRRYSPDNMVFSIAGRFDWDQYVEHVEKYTAAWEVSNTSREHPSQSFQSVNKQFSRENLNLVHLMFMLPAPSAQDDLRYASVVWNNMIADSAGSKLYWDLLEPGLIDSLYCWSDDRDQAGVSHLYITCLPENLEKATKAVKNYLENPFSFDDNDLAAAKNKIASRIAISAEYPFNRMIGIGEDLLYRNEVTPITQVVDKLQAVNQASIESLFSNFSYDAYGEYQLMPK